MLDKVSAGVGTPSRQRNAVRVIADVVNETDAMASAVIIETDPQVWRRRSRLARTEPVGGALKRGFDICAAGVGLIILAPLLAVIWLMVRMERNGALAVFKQQRGGFDGKPFQIYKFRTMVCAENGKDVNDDRITPLGRFLRRMSWDELPQLFNVLKGDMSIVGPRPHALEHDRSFAEIDATYPQRFAARPGITGLAQVSGCRGPTETDEKVVARTGYDVEYTRTWSLWADIKILGRTMLLVVKRDPGAI
ncbi:MAG: sugar transferase [Hyphomonadaceae bacterium JAD_PAG50586_4]|nr:MAG: sugar transferase [Hyphomonadaceae bacterium JAD_PAG50586_4]